MSRPQKRRCVRREPNFVYFKPAGVRKRDLEEVVLLVEEFEALRLKDFLGLGQAECAQRIGVSQPTFHRLILLARKKVSGAIFEGKAIKIDGGNYSCENF